MYLDLELLMDGGKIHDYISKTHKIPGKVFCIGNGESRKGFDLEKLRPHGTIYGCNAIYRDFMPDVLTAVDHGIMHEIYHAGVAQKIPCYFRDWTKVPRMTYEPMLMGGITNLEEAKARGGTLYVFADPTPGINWIRQWKTLFAWYPDIKFIKVNRFNDGRDLVNGPIEEWTNKNLTYTDYSTLDNLA